MFSAYAFRVIMFGPHGVAGRVRVQDVAHRADDVGLDLAQLRVARERRSPSARSASQRRISATCASSKRASATASSVEREDEARRARHPVARGRTSGTRPTRRPHARRGRATRESPPSVCASGT